jgi:hypothetical protein
MGSLASQKLATTLATLFGAVALLLSAVGIWQRDDTSAAAGMHVAGLGASRVDPLIVLKDQ